MVDRKRPPSERPERKISPEDQALVDRREAFLATSWKEIKFAWTSGRERGVADPVVLLIDGHDPVGYRIVRKIMGDIEADRFVNNPAAKGLVPTFAYALPRREFTRTYAVVNPESPLFQALESETPPGYFPLLIIAFGGKQLRIMENLSQPLSAAPSSPPGHSQGQPDGDRREALADLVQLMDTTIETIEHCWAQAQEAGVSDCVVLVIDVRDPVGYRMARPILDNRNGRGATDRLVRDFTQRRRTPTVHLAIPRKHFCAGWRKSEAPGEILEALESDLADSRPEDFPVVVIAAGGKELYWMRRPS